MSGNIRLYNTNGYVELQAPTSATNQTLVLPTDSIKPALVHIDTQTFSNSLSIVFDNCFLSSYSNYRIVMYLRGTTSALNMRMRSSGSSDTSTSYYRRYLEAWSTSVATNYVLSTFMTVGYANGRAIVSMDIFKPNESDNTVLSIKGGYGTTAGTSSFGVYDFYNVVATTTQYDGFVIDSASTELSGDISVYGYRNA